MDEYSAFMQNQIADLVNEIGISDVPFKKMPMPIGLIPEIPPIPDLLRIGLHAKDPKITRKY